MNPAIAVYLCERFKLPNIRSEVSKFVRSNTVDVLDVPEAVPFLVEERLDASVRRDLKVSKMSVLLTLT